MAKIEVVCGDCKKVFRALEEDLDELVCPECEGKLVPRGPTAAAPDQAAPQASAPAKQAEAAPQPPKPAEKPPPQGQEPRAISGDKGDAKGLEQVASAYEAILGQLDKVIVGQKTVIEEIVVAVLTGGHCLLEGVPGLAKTLLISSLAEAMSLSFKRIQFTPDLLPSDITGTDIIQDDPETGKRGFKFLPGPIFANIILADEINRTPPKTQAAMLEAMQEKQVSIGRTVHKLAEPFFVLATQNPLEQEGTYALPEAQQDRFLFKIFVDYPSVEEEREVVRRVTERTFKRIEPVLQAEDILAAQELVTHVPVAETVVEYAARLVRATRLGGDEALDSVSKWIAWGCGPRASISLVAAAKARSILHGANCASCEDIACVAHPVMRHRFAVNYAARAEGITTDTVIDRLLEEIPKY